MSEANGQYLEDKIFRVMQASSTHHSTLKVIKSLLLLLFRTRARKYDIDELKGCHKPMLTKDTDKRFERQEQPGRMSL